MLSRNASHRYHNNNKWRKGARNFYFELCLEFFTQEEAKSVLKGFNLVIPMSRINFDIWRVIKQVLKWTVTAQSLHHNSAAAPHTAQSVSAFKDAHHDFYQTFEQHNKLDLELLEWAEAMFDSKFSAGKGVCVISCSVVCSAWLLASNQNVPVSISSAGASHIYSTRQIQLVMKSSVRTKSGVQGT